MALARRSSKAAPGRFPKRRRHIPRAGRYYRLAVVGGKVAVTPPPTLVVYPIDGGGFFPS